MSLKSISTQALQRMPLYLNYLKALPADTYHISATTIAEDLRLNDVQVRKDLAAVGQGGKPKVGYVVKELIGDMEHCLGYDNIDSAVLIGVGNLGRTLLEYEGFSEFGIDIAVVFDDDEGRQGKTIYGKTVLPVSKLYSMCQRMKIKLGIIAVSAKEAQNICDILVKSGVMAIWNFAPIRLQAPNHVLIHNENMASSLAVLSNHLADKFQGQHTVSKKY